MANALAVPAGFGLAVVVLLAAGRGALATPPIRGFAAWFEARGALTAAVAVVRLLALAAATWMLVVAVAVAVARLGGAGRLARRLERGLPPAVRRALTGLIGLGVTGSVVLGGDGRSLAPPLARAPVEQPIGFAAGPAQAAPTDDTVTMSVLDRAPVAPEAPEWTVEPGESFWSIAEDVLTERLGRPPTDREIVPYWRRLVEANRDRLRTGDPDLVFPGQTFVIPPSA